MDRDVVSPIRGRSLSPARSPVTLQASAGGAAEAEARPRFQRTGTAAQASAKPAARSSLSERAEIMQVAIAQGRSPAQRLLARQQFAQLHSAVRGSHFDEYNASASERARIMELKRNELFSSGAGAWAEYSDRVSPRVSPRAGKDGRDSTGQRILLRAQDLRERQDSPRSRHAHVNETPRVAVATMQGDQPVLTLRSDHVASARGIDSGSRRVVRSRSEFLNRLSAIASTVAATPDDKPLSPMGTSLAERVAKRRQAKIGTQAAQQVDARGIPAPR